VTDREGRLGGVYAAIGKRVGDRLSSELMSAERLEPRLTMPRLLAYVIAALVYAWVLVLVAAGTACIVLIWPNPFGILIALIPLSVAFFMRPRFGKPPEDNLVDRPEAPALWELVDQVANALETKHVDRIVISDEFNASWAVLGLRRVRVLTLGLPLLAMLPPQARVALIAHELAHARNGDSGRGLFVGSAIRALEELYALFSPDPHLSGAGEEYALGFFDRITNAAMWVVSRPILGLLYLELYLVLQDSQRAEYLADALAAGVAGTDAAILGHEQLLLDSTFQAAVQQAAHDRGGDSDLFAALAARATDVPERERERRRRVARLEETRLGASHPPTARRLELLEARAAFAAKVTLDAERSEAIDRELEPMRAAIQRHLVDEYRDSLYYG
jgi:heat shock protein HtpX